ncbi:MAG: MFS transporter [Gammaproteobacteria bacterium]|nr:MFS transporter [Gammaproteobacteria bacterium]
MTVADGAAAPESAAPESAAPRGLIALLAASSALGPVSTLMLMPALPAIRAEFGASTAATQAVISVFLFVFALGIPFAGPVSDRHGRRPLLLGGIAVFLAGSVLGALAPTLEVLVLARAVQALGCAATATVARAVLGDIFPDWRLARALATMTLVMMSGTAISPYLGGLITERLGWHAPLTLLSVLAALIGLAALRGLPETRVARDGLMTYGELGRASRRVLRNPTFLGCVIDAGVVYAIYLGFISIAPYVMSEMLGRPATSFGLYLLLLSAGYFAGNVIVTRLKGHADLDRVARFGNWLQAASALLALGFVLAGHTHPLFWFGPMLPLAFAQGLLLPHVTATAVRLAPGYAGVASGLIGFSQQAIAAAAVQGLGFVDTGTPLPVLTVCAALSLVSLAAMLMLERALRAQEPAA